MIWRSRAPTTITPGQTTRRSFTEAFYDYTAIPLSGLWRAFSAESQTDAKTYDPAVSSTPPVAKTTKTFYNANCTPDTPPTNGDLRRLNRYYDAPLNLPNGTLLHSQDTTYAHDTYGNQTSITTYAGAGTYTSGTTSYSVPGGGSAARTTSTSYDTTFNAFPTQQTNPISQIERADYDYRMGTLIRVIGPNTTGTPTDCRAASYSIPATEEMSCAQYDGFGRLVKLVKPGDSTSYPTVQATSYDSEQPFR